MACLVGFTIREKEGLGLVVVSRGLVLQLLGPPLVPALNQTLGALPVESMSQVVQRSTATAFSLECPFQFWCRCWFEFSICHSGLPALFGVN